MRRSLSFSLEYLVGVPEHNGSISGLEVQRVRDQCPGPSQRLRGEAGLCSGAASTVSPHFLHRVRDWLSHVEGGSEPGSSSTLKASLCDFARFATTARPSCLCHPGSQGAQEGGTETGASEEAGMEWPVSLASCANIGAYFPGFVQFGNNGV